MPISPARVAARHVKTASVEKYLDSLAGEAVRVRKEAHEESVKILENTRAAEHFSEVYLRRRGITVESIKIEYETVRHDQAWWVLTGSFLIDPSMDDEDAEEIIEELGGYFRNHPRKDPYSSKRPRRWKIEGDGYSLASVMALL